MTTQPTPTDEGIAMARYAYYGLTSPEDEPGPEGGDLSPAELSSLVDLVTAQIEYHQSEIARLRPILHRLQDRIPNQPLKEFINELEL